MTASACASRDLTDENPNAVAFSIITVCFSDLVNLVTTAESVRNQEFSDFEWIVVDGGGPDATRVWLEAQRDPRLRWVSESDHGIFDAMNKGIEMSVGRYLIFMNSGDSFASTTVLARVADDLRGRTIVPKLLAGSSIRFSPAGSEFLVPAKKPGAILYSMFAQHQAMFFARSDIRYDLRFSLSADYAYTYMHLNASAAAEVVLLGFPVCRYLLGGQSETRRLLALKEDYRIRRQVMKMSVAVCATLWLLHAVHTIGKRSRVVLMNLVR